MQSIPHVTTNTALFLDFDGTLVALAQTPGAIAIPPMLIALLTDLHALLGGALALVSGRQIAVLDHFLSPLLLPSAGEHGAQRRNANGRMLEQTRPDFGSLEDACNRLAGDHHGLLVERKHAAVALHYRLAPGLKALCHETLSRAIKDRPQFALIQGKFVVEAVPVGVKKGNAIAAFLAEPPFAGRAPVFVGDDNTDESGFSIVQSRGGIGIKVGAGPSLARHRLACAGAVCEWLMAVRDHLVHTAREKRQQ